MSNPKLTTRMKRYFERRLALSQTMLASHAELENDVELDGIEHFAERQREYAKDSATLRREYELLLRDWSAADDMDDEERAEVQAVSAEAERLAQELVAKNDRAIETLQTRMNALKATSVNMRRTLQVMRKFRQDGSPAPGFIDRKT